MADDLIKKLPGLFKSLQSSDLYTRDALPVDWKGKVGVYVFYENGDPIYVGRGKDLRGRILQHGRQSVQDTPLAFHLTAKKLGYKTNYRKGKGRTKFKSQKNFKTTFATMKDRVAKMKVRGITIDNDPKGILNHLFEAYVAAKLDTPYNSFLTS